MICSTVSVYLRCGTKVRRMHRLPGSMSLSSLPSSRRSLGVSLQQTASCFPKKPDKLFYTIFSIDFGHVFKIYWIRNYNSVKFNMVLQEKYTRMRVKECVAMSWLLHSKVPQVFYDQSHLCHQKHLMLQWVCELRELIYMPIRSDKLTLPLFRAISFGQDTVHVQI